MRFSISFPARRNRPATAALPAQQDQTQHSQKTSRRRRLARRACAAVGSITMCLLLPLMTLQIILYRQNLAMAREHFPAAPTFTSGDRILVLSPHCDDETLGAGGTIAAARAAGVPVRVVFLTNGDGSRSTQIAEDARQLSFRPRRDSYQQLARLRQREAIAAVGELGVAARDVIFLGYPDGGTQAMWETHWSPQNLYRSPYTGTDHSPYPNSHTPNAAYCGTQALRDVTAVIAAWKPTVVITTSPSDTHGDHWAAYAYCAAALESLRLRPSTRAWASRVQLLTFLVHCGWWPAPHGYHPDARLAPPAKLKDIGTRWTQAPLDKPSRKAKEAALNRYVSQLALTPKYLRGFLRRNELFGTVPVQVVATRATEGKRHEMGSGEHRASGITHHASLVVRDSVRDSAVHDVWPAADLRGVSLTAVGSTTRTANNVLLRVHLSKSPSRRLLYRLSLHTVTRAGETATVQSYPLQIRQRKGVWRCVVGNEETSALPMAAVAGGFEIKVPYDVLHLSQPPFAVLISAGSYLSRTRLDQTETGTLRLISPERARPIHRTPIGALMD
ncbi:MAG TPA: PIG-L family deacetylase [Abditibacteriaceae bacterium]|nr:PIG-L family deacetylase [Abditibacteriaceae bacterium]